MPNPAVNRTACKLRLQVPSAFGSGSRLPLRCAAQFRPEHRAVKAFPALLFEGEI